MNYLSNVLLCFFFSFLCRCCFCSNDDNSGIQRGEPFIQGTLKVNGKSYRAICNCNQGLTEAEQKLAEVVPMCNPSKVKIHQDKSAEGGLTASDVRAIWGQPADATFANISELHFACLDDRITAPSLYTPGGDLGEFALAITACGSNPNDAQIVQILNAYLASMPGSRKFYHCTDDDALEHIESYLGLEGVDMFSPDPNTQAEILKALEQPRNVGDMHFRSMMKNPGWYHAERGECRKKKGLATAIIKSFFTVFWDPTNINQKRLQLEVLAGRRSPQAFIEVATTQDCEAAGIAPLLKAKDRRARALINHTNAINNRRKEISTFFSSQGFCSLSAEELASRMDRYGLTWLESTGARLGRDLPFYRISFL